MYNVCMKKKLKKYYRFNFLIKNKLIDQFKEVAKDQEMNKSALIRQLIRKEITSHYKRK